MLLNNASFFNVAHSIKTNIIKSELLTTFMA